MGRLHAGLFTTCCSPLLPWKKHATNDTTTSNGTRWTLVSLPENFLPPLASLTATWSCIFLVDNRRSVFYAGRYFCQDWTEHSHCWIEDDDVDDSSRKNTTTPGAEWKLLENEDIRDIQHLSASSNLLVLVGATHLIVFPCTESSSSPSKHRWFTWALPSSNSTSREGGGCCQSVATGRGYFLLVTSDGDVYGWGTNDYGQLGIVEQQQQQQHSDSDDTQDKDPVITCKYCDSLTRIEAVPSGMALKVACCDMSSAILLKNGQVMVFGNNLYLQLGTHLCCPIQVPQTLDTFSTHHPARDIAMHSWQMAVMDHRGQVWLSGKEPIHPLQREHGGGSLSPTISLSTTDMNSCVLCENDDRCCPHRRLIAGNRYFLLQTSDAIYGYGSGLRDYILPSYTKNDDWVILKQWTTSPLSSQRQQVLVAAAENDILIYEEKITTGDMAHPRSSR